MKWGRMLEEELEGIQCKGEGLDKGVGQKMQLERGKIGLRRGRVG